MNTKILDLLAMILVVIGAINWGLIGLGGPNLVTLILGSVPTLVTLTYIVVGIAGLYAAYLTYKMAK
jgi:uncharacterized membrane protein YuzA (DUF378 family)